MKKLRIIHATEYHYHQPVTFGPHRVMMRPREGHDIHIEVGRWEVHPKPEVRWLRDIYGNSIAVLTFAEKSDRLRIMGGADIAYLRANPMECLIDPGARLYPFQYPPDEQVELIPYRLPSYPYEGPQLREWLTALYKPGDAVETFALLNRLNAHIHDTIAYSRREESGVQLPCDTLRRGSGSCRDFAVLMMEAARHWGFASRFVSGYVQLAAGQHGATHAWTEIYIPGAGWHGFDPTNNKMVGDEHISVAVAREQEKACPVSGWWEGPTGAFSHMEVSVQVFEI
ncbi:MAG: transglutaminase family protein [Proteobacteria bacterium]|nr:transglutaminase family protein [Pseudomonadota bacterium]